MNYSLHPLLFCKPCERSTTFNPVLSEIRKLRFSGHNNLNTIELHNSLRILAAGDSAEQIDALNKEIQKLRNKLAELDPRLQAAQVEHDSILKASQQVGQRLKDAKQELLAFRICNEKVNIAERKLAEFTEDATRDNAAEKEKAIRKLKKLIQNSTSILLAAGACHEGLMKSNYAMSAEKMKEHYVSASLEKVKNKLAEKLSETRNLEKDFDCITRKFNNLKEKLKENKNKAEAIAPMQDSRGNDLPLKAELELLPATIEEIQIAIDEANQKIQSIADNPEVIRQYEDRLREIAKIKEDIAASAEAHDAKKMDLNGR
jgi:DNA repair exonuclease SbcCD ATPase subunit